MPHLRRWRIPLLLSAIVLAAQFAHATPLVDVVTGLAPAGFSLFFPLSHIIFAPFTLLADFLNGGSRRDLTGFLVWLALFYILLRLARGGTSLGRETIRALLFVAGTVLFFAWALFVARPIPRLVVDRGLMPDALVWDSHSHSAASHDGRHGFDAHKNARWHQRAGFDAAFLTDHNNYGAVRAWRIESAGKGPRLLDGEELSLFGLHLVVLGNTSQLANEPMNHSWDSTLTLARRLARPDSAHAAADTLLLIASLPEYWEHHWGEDLRDLTLAGVRGFEIWTTSPTGMAIPDATREVVIARARLTNLVVTGATDMHGLGRTASVWNVTTLRGWRDMDDRRIERSLIARLAAGGFAANRVIAIPHRAPSSRIGQALAVPVGLFGALSRATPLHAAALLLWVWGVAVVTGRRKRPTP